MVGDSLGMDRQWLLGLLARLQHCKLGSGCAPGYLFSLCPALCGWLLLLPLLLLQASDAVRQLPVVQSEYKALEVRYAAAVELLGERDEQLEEMAADLADVKQLYKQQIESLVAALAESGVPTASS